MRYLKFKAILSDEGWIEPGYTGLDDTGIITYLSRQAPPEAAAIEFVNGFGMRGFVNAHSHAFQYAMAGIAEQHAPNTDDDFWSWREAMYECALSVNPEQMEAIATMLYSEMLCCGYTHVVEFHYLHHDRDGQPYANKTEMADRLISAATTAGIGITLVPVFYQNGGFGKPPEEKQRRFISKSPDEYFRLLNAVIKSVSLYHGAKSGFSVHSLRAVSLEDIVTTYTEGPKDVPFHLHLAEQKKEITDCMAWCALRPAQWLIQNLPVNNRFNLVHATHLDDAELQALSASGACIVLCPSTEGNLGDGIFRMKEYVAKRGRWTIGTDSHISLNPLEELRMIDYRQRLVTNKRNTFPGDAGGYLIGESIERGRHSAGLEGGHLAAGQFLDAVVYDATSPLIENTSVNHRMSTLVYASNEGKVSGTIFHGKWVVKDGRHIDRDSIRNKFRIAISEIAIR